MIARFPITCSLRRLIPLTCWRCSGRRRRACRLVSGNLDGLSGLKFLCVPDFVELLNLVDGDSVLFCNCAESFPTSDYVSLCSACICGSRFLDTSGARFSG